MSVAPGCKRSSRAWENNAWSAADGKRPGRFQLHAELWETNACGLHLYVVLSGERATVRVQSSFWEVEKGWWGDDWGYIEQS